MCKSKDFFFRSKIFANISHASQCPLSFHSPKKEKAVTRTIWDNKCKQPSTVTSHSRYSSSLFLSTPRMSFFNLISNTNFTKISR